MIKSGRSLLWGHTDEDSSDELTHEKGGAEHQPRYSHPVTQITFVIVLLLLIFFVIIHRQTIKFTKVREEEI